MLDIHFHNRLLRAENTLERIKNNPAPTVPIYDLNPAGGTVFYIQSNITSVYVPLAADTSYLHEFHLIGGDHLDWYVDSILKQTILAANFFCAPSFDTFSIGFDCGTLNPFSSIDSSDITYMWDMKWGTSRGAGDLFSNNMDVAPSIPPWTSEFSSHLAAITNPTIGGITVSQIGGTIGSRLGYTGVSNPIDSWYTFNLRVPSSTINIITTADDSSYTFEIRANDHSQIIARMFLGLTGD